MTNPVSKTKHESNKPLRRKKLMNQLLILALVPSIVAFGFMAILLFSEYKSMYQTRHVAHIVDYMVKASYLVHELQKERGTSSGYIGIRGKDMARELNSQRLITDREYLALKRYLDLTDTDQYGKKCCYQLESFLNKLESLRSIREDVTSLSITRDQVIEYFSETINYAIKSFKEANFTIKESPLSFPFTACVNFIVAKEMAGIERALITGFAAEDKPISESAANGQSVLESDMHKWMRVLKGQDALFSAFEHQVTGEILEEFHNVLSGDNTKILEDIRERLYEKHEDSISGGKYGLMPLDVFTAATKRINELKMIEDMQTSRILHFAEKTLAYKTKTFIVYIILTVISITAIFVLCIITARRITRPVTILSTAAKHFASGKLDYKIDIKANNEIGELASNFVQMCVQRQRIEKERESLIDDLSYINKELDDFSYVVSHDLKAPLRAIQNYADFLKKDLQGSLGEEQEMYLEGLGEAVSQSEEYLDNLLELSRVGKHQVMMKNINIGAFLHELTNSLGLPSDVKIIIKDNWPDMNVEPTFLRQILQNLIINGIKFNQSSEKTIEIGWHLIDNKHYDIFVKDNGIGIEPRFFKKIFSPFQRLHTAEEYEGTGIGLATVLKAANRLEWPVRLESKPGEGSTFFVTIRREDS